MKLFIFSLLTAFILISCSDKQDIVTTSSGARYVDVVTGEGRIANEGDLVAVHFKGWIVKDSTDLFSDWINDSTKYKYLIADSYIQGKEVRFPLSEGTFVKGSLEGIKGMQVGGKRIIVIPSNIAYGEQGAGPIPPNTDLRIIVEMIKISDAVVAEMWDLNNKEIQVSETGLKYVIIEEGEGNHPTEGNVVTVHYSGFFEDGNKFDSSVERDEPFSFVVGNKSVIAGWDEGIKLLKKGGKARLIIPPDLGYGNVAKGIIPANSTLIFDVELVDVK